MSQMKPYCFKCGAELDPDAIHCPECGRLQRSTVVRAGEPPSPGSGSPEDQPYHFYADRDAAGAEHREPAGPHPDQHDPYAPQHPEHDWQAGQQTDGYGGQPPYADHGGNEVYARQDHEQQQPGEQPWPDSYPHGQAGQGYPGSAEADAAYGYQDPGAYSGQPEPGHGQPEPGYGQPEPGYGQPDPAYGQPEPAYGQPEPGYGQPEGVYDRQDAAYDHRQPPHGQQHPPPYGQPEPEPPGQQWQSRAEPYPPPEPYTPPAPIYQQPTPPPAAPEPVEEPSGPVYRSSAPLPAGSLERYGVPPPPTGGFAPEPQGPGRYGQPRSGSPYSLATYEPDPTYGRPARRSPVRLIALGAAALLGLFLLAFVAGQCLGGRSSGSPAANTQQTAQPSTAPSTRPSAAPSATPAPTATAEQGITGTARFVRVSSSIPSRCSTAQGCPVEVVLKNSGGSGSGTVTVTLTDDGGNPIATFTGPIPVTDAGATATVDGYATGDQLGTYLKSGGVVHITSVDVKSGG